MSDRAEIAGGVVGEDGFVLVPGVLVLGVLPPELELLLFDEEVLELFAPELLDPELLDPALLEPLVPVALVSDPGGLLESRPGVEEPDPDPTDCCWKGSRAEPLSLDLPRLFSRLTTGKPGAAGGALALGADAGDAAGAGEADLLNSVGTATSATSKAAATGHSRFSRRSSMSVFRGFISRVG